MRLSEYLDTIDSGPNPHMNVPFPASSLPEPPLHGVDPLAHLDGGFVRFQSRHHVPSPLGGGQYDGTTYDDHEALRFRHYLGGTSIWEGLDEGKKREHGSYDHRAMGKLKDGKYPARAEDGKGFCFICSGGSIHAFRWRNDALRWANSEPREITKFWYGDPVAPSGKFRVRVRDRYVKDEAVQDRPRRFSDLLQDARVAEAVR